MGKQLIKWYWLEQMSDRIERGADIENGHNRHSSCMCDIGGRVYDIDSSSMLQE